LKIVQIQNFTAKNVPQRRRHIHLAKNELSE